MVNRWVVLGWLNIRGRVFVPVHTTVNHRWPDMTPGKSITTHDCIGLLRERVCVYVCVCVDCPLLHHTVIKAGIGCCGVSRAVCVCVCVSCGGAYGFTESCTWVNLYLVRPWLVSAPTATEDDLQRISVRQQPPWRDDRVSRESTGLHRCGKNTTRGRENGQGDWGTAKHREGDGYSLLGGALSFKANILWICLLEWEWGKCHSYICTLSILLNGLV